MLAVVVLKALSLFCEAEEKSYLERTGSARGWDVLFYIFSFLKGISLFTLMILIGTGWSSNPTSKTAKKVLMAVIPLQVVANVAQVAIDKSCHPEAALPPRRRCLLLHRPLPNFLVHQEPPGGRQDRR
ncbi:unnamed protein product [Musa acuminata subsp. burmannicoides]